MRLLVEAQAGMDAGIAAQCSQADAVSGFLLDAISPAAMTGDALEQVFAVIDAEEAGVGEAAIMSPGAGDRASRRAAEAAGQAMKEILNLPESVRNLALESGAVWSFAGPGVRKMALMDDHGAKAELIRLEPGRGVPHHGHDGREFTLVLTGAFHDGRARYARGELCAADPSTEHKPVAEEGEVCIALAVTDGPLAFTGPLGWVQRALNG